MKILDTPQTTKGLSECLTADVWIDVIVPTDGPAHAKGQS
jgi:hypothetical protein